MLARPRNAGPKRSVAPAACLLAVFFHGLLRRSSGRRPERSRMKRSAARRDETCMVTKAHTTTSHGEMAGWWPSRDGPDNEDVALNEHSSCKPAWAPGTHALAHGHIGGRI